MFSVDFGGKAWCATVSGMLDVVGYASVIPFNALSGWAADRYGWGAVVGGLAALSAAATVVFATFMNEEAARAAGITDAKDMASDSAHV